MQNHHILKTTVYTILFLFMLFTIAMVISKGIEKESTHQCITHKENLTMYQDYYLTGNQLDTCLALDILVEDDFVECNGLFYYTPEGTGFHCEV